MITRILHGKTYLQALSTYLLPTVAINLIKGHKTILIERFMDFSFARSPV